MFNCPQWGGLLGVNVISAPSLFAPQRLVAVLLPNHTSCDSLVTERLVLSTHDPVIILEFFFYALRGYVYLAELVFYHHPQSPSTTVATSPITLTTDHTADPITTTEPPITTTEAPVTMTESPITTTEAPVTATEAPIAMTAGYIVTATVSIDGVWVGGVGGVKEGEREEGGKGPGDREGG